VSRRISIGQLKSRDQAFAIHGQLSVPYYVSSRRIAQFTGHTWLEIVRSLLSQC
jgi:hypothetical protein